MEVGEAPSMTDEPRVRPVRPWGGTNFRRQGHLICGPQLVLVRGLRPSLRRRRSLRGWMVTKPLVRTEEGRDGRDWTKRRAAGVTLAGEEGRRARVRVVSLDVPRRSLNLGE